MPAPLQGSPELAESWSQDYWLRRCENYRVDTPDGPFGFVDHVVFSDIGEPESLVVRVGRFQTRLMVVPFVEVAEIRPEREVLALRSAQRI
jgi:hypothetical protein